MATDLTRSLSYRRAVYAKAPKDHETLEDFVSAAFDKLPTILQHRISYSGGYTLESRHQKKGKKHGHYIHLVAYTTGEKASIVPTKTDVIEADIATAPPPVGSDFMDGDIMALVVKNDVLICSSGLHESKLQTYLTALFDAAELAEDSRHFHLTRTADVSVLSTLAKEGIKSVSFDSSIYEATVSHGKRTSTTKKINGSIWDHVLELFSDDKSFKDVLEEENISAEITFSFDARRKGEIGPQRLNVLGKTLVQEGDSEFEFKTCEGNTIRGNQMTIRKQVKLPKDGKTVSYSAAFTELGQYYLELKSNGLLEQ